MASDIEQVTYLGPTRDPALRRTEQWLREHLEREQAHRGQHSNTVTGYDALDRPVNEPEWRVRERNLMWRLVNDERRRRDLPQVEMRAVRQVEDALSGRADYSTRLVEVLARCAHGRADDLLAAPNTIKPNQSSQFSQSSEHVQSGLPPDDDDTGFPWADTYLSPGPMSRLLVVALALAGVLLGVLHLGRALLNQ